MGDFPPGQDPFASPDQIAAFAGAADQLRLLVEIVAGHKRQLMEAGFGEEAAESMSVIFYGEIARQIFL